MPTVSYSDRSIAQLWAEGKVAPALRCIMRRSTWVDRKWKDEGPGCVVRWVGDVSTKGKGTSKYPVFLFDHCSRDGMSVYRVLWSMLHGGVVPTDYRVYHACHGHDGILCADPTHMFIAHISVSVRSVARLKKAGLIRRCLSMDGNVMTQVITADGNAVEVEHIVCRRVAGTYNEFCASVLGTPVKEAMKIVGGYLRKKSTHRVAEVICDTAATTGCVVSDRMAFNEKLENNIRDRMRSIRNGR